MAKLPLQFHSGARMDAFEAFDWYAKRSQNAADAFQEELENAGKSIQHSPERCAPYLFGTRRYLMKRFPYVVVYRIAASRIEILAVAHGRRRPGYWRHRLKSQ
jgi:toxin ParE1/3/4